GVGHVHLLRRVRSVEFQVPVDDDDGHPGVLEVVGVLRVGGAAHEGLEDLLQSARVEPADVFDLLGSGGLLCQGPLDGTSGALSGGVVEHSGDVGPPCPVDPQRDGGSGSGGGVLGLALHLLQVEVALALEFGHLAACLLDLVRRLLHSTSSPTGSRPCSTMWISMGLVSILLPRRYRAVPSSSRPVSTRRLPRISMTVSHSSSGQGTWARVTSG